MGIPTVTALYGSLNALLNIYLANEVSRIRRRDHVSIGGDSKHLVLAVRTHGNNAEAVPFALLLLLIAELCQGASLWLHIAGGLLLVARISHVVGMPRPAPNPFRVFGVGATWTVTVGLACWALWLRRAG